MAKELYLYTPIYDESARDLIAEIESNMDEDITMRESCPGGSVFATHGICAKITEHGNVTIKVDGYAGSSGANLLPYAKRVECLDVSRFTLHRADMYCETPEDQKFLDAINKDLKAKLLLKVDAGKFKEVTGYTINDMFNPAQRININLSASDAKKIGLVDKVNTLSPKELTAINAKLYAVSATTEVVEVKEIKTKKSDKKMDLQTLKAEHPALVAQISAEVKAQVLEDERDRCGAWMKISEIDPKACADGIASGKNISQTVLVDAMLKKTVAPTALTTLENEAAPAVATPEAGAIKAPTAETAKDAEKLKKDADLKAFRDEANKQTVQAGITLKVY